MPFCSDINADQLDSKSSILPVSQRCRTKHLKLRKSDVQENAHLSRVDTMPQLLCSCLQQAERRDRLSHKPRDIFSKEKQNLKFRKFFWLFVSNVSGSRVILNLDYMGDHAKRLRTEILQHLVGPTPSLRSLSSDFRYLRRPQRINLTHSIQ